MAVVICVNRVMVLLVTLLVILNDCSVTEYNSYRDHMVGYRPSSG